MHTPSPILATLAFFQIFGRPLARRELKRWCWGELPVMSPELQKWGWEDLTAALPAEVEERDGYVYLKNHSYPNRMEQAAINAQLMAKAERYLPMLRRIPGIRFCGVGNTLAFGAADADSDIDLLIITRKHMIWWVRWWVTALLHLRGVRRHGNKVAGRFCLSFFLDETAMDLSRIAIEEDIYLRYWIATLHPIFGEATFRRFQEANRAFVEPLTLHTTPTSRDGGNRTLELFLLTLGRPLLWFMRWIQRQKMKHLPVHLGPGAYVVVNDHMLKFHNNDRRAKFRDEWHAILKTLK